MVLFSLSKILKVEILDEFSTDFYKKVCTKRRILRRTRSAHLEHPHVNISEDIGDRRKIIQKCQQLDYLIKMFKIYVTMLKYSVIRIYTLETFLYPIKLIAKHVKTAFKSVQICLRQIELSSVKHYGDIFREV